MIKYIFFLVFFSTLISSCLSSKLFIYDKFKTDVKVCIKEDILKELQKLPNKTRMVFNLYVFEGLSHREISQELDITEGTSHWHVNNARKIIKTLINYTSAIAL